MSSLTREDLYSLTHLRTQPAHAGICPVLPRAGGSGVGDGPRAVKTLSAGLYRDNVCLGYKGRNTVGGSDSHSPRMQGSLQMALTHSHLSGNLMTADLLGEGQAVMHRGPEALSEGTVAWLEQLGRSRVHLGSLWGRAHRRALATSLAKPGCSH